MPQPILNQALSPKERTTNRCDNIPSQKAINSQDYDQKISKVITTHKCDNYRKLILKQDSFIWGNYARKCQNTLNGTSNRKKRQISNH